MLRTTVVTLALTTGLVWGMVGCSTMGKKNAPLDMYLGTVTVSAGNLGCLSGGVESDGFASDTDFGTWVGVKLSLIAKR
jgi:hypothetical protein